MSDNCSVKKKPPSKLRVSKCSYCGKELLEQNLNRHCKTEHNQSRLASGETHVTSYFTKKRKLTQENVIESNSTFNTKLDENTTVEDQFTKSSSTPEAINKENILEEILGRVKNIQISIDQKKTTDKEKLKSNNSIDGEQRFDQLQLCRSIHEICNIFEFLTYDAVQVCVISNLGVCYTSDMTQCNFNSSQQFRRYV